ncbi:hypothetical protein G6L68_25330 [Agrobacterium fabrum]|uniref:hypothetical protein n=1 Tax=Agrobacterium fabrum TaxID=1176649 RepID=UPI000EF60457|nr:hypothetical protein [Agrobacterium fabrum]AYM66212.1 hypothetical protein At12D13_50600 [Agrobacterium fabrum]NTE63957.1 hypothetical protein [Agrobacterium fabrum]
MRVVRNWVLPIIFTGIGALVGLIVIGLPGFEMVQTIDGSPVLGGFIPPEQVSTVIDQGKRIGSYIDFYGVALPGPPLYWTAWIVAAATLVGYWLGSRFKVTA